MQPAILAAPEGGPPVQTHVLFEGSEAVTWRADDATVTITYADLGAFRATSRVVFDGAPVSEQSKSFAEILSGGGAPPLSSAPYTCGRSEEHTSELQSLMRISYAVFCLKQKNN